MWVIARIKTLIVLVEEEDAKVVEEKIMGPGQELEEMLSANTSMHSILRVGEDKNWLRIML